VILSVLVVGNLSRCLHDFMEHFGNNTNLAITASANLDIPQQF